MTSFRLIPPVDELLKRQGLSAAVRIHGRALVTDAVRRAAAEMREAIARGDSGLPETTGAMAEWIERRADRHIASGLRPSFRSVINATGVVVHTNLGRAPLAAEALQRVSETGAGYSNLEYDLEAGTRGRRDMHADVLLTELTGAEASLVTNNNAAAVLLILSAIAAGREVIVSRGELVEIGGGFRVPDVLAESGAVLREVGTTNRTRAADYAAAIGPKTAALLRVHPSNFTIEGFTERPTLDELAALGRRFEIPVIDDLGSGWLGLTSSADDQLASEPSVTSSLAAGADLVTFSGDKLLGGPQAGIIVGRRALVERIARHPLMRAVRAGKLTYAALEATLALWRSLPSRQRIPVYRMVTMAIETLSRRAHGLERRLSGTPGLSVSVIDGESTVGGGSAPGSALPTALVALSADGLSASAIEAGLRAGDPPVVARIAGDRVLVDLRTVAEHEDDLLADAIVSAVTRAPENG